MIRLTSTPTAEAVVRLENCAGRAHELENLGQNLPDAVANCYRHQDVKASIINETAGKCAYCESRITHVYWGEVEHIKPKNPFPESRLDYDNLTLACAICNNKKGDYYSEETPILHPYDDIPADHLVGLGALIWHRNASPRGQRTIVLLDLNRAALNERRFECIQRLSELADRYINEPDGRIKNALGAQIRDEVADAAEYALVARSFLLATYDLRWDAI